MREGVNDLVDAHSISEAGELQVARVFLGVRPLPAVAHVGVPVDEHHRPAVVVEDRAEMRSEATLLPASSREERPEPRHLRIGVKLVETAEDRMIPGNLDDLTI